MSTKHQNRRETCVACCVQGYIFVELGKLTHSDVTVCEKLAEALAKKLEKGDAVMKWKALALMKNVSKSGRPEFRRCLQRHVDAIKACLAYKTALDPLRGDEPSRRVRDTAKEALEAIFDSSTSSGLSSAAGSRITGMGGGPSGAGAYPPAASSYPPAGGSGSAFPPAHRPGASTGFTAPAFTAPAFGSGALPGTPGYDPTSMLHAAIVTTGAMVRTSVYVSRLRILSCVHVGHVAC